MKAHEITIPAANLKTALQWFKPYVGSSTLPILECVFFERDGATITARVTDLDNHLTFALDGVKAGAKALPCIVPFTILKTACQAAAADSLITVSTPRKGPGFVNYQTKHAAMSLEFEQFGADEFPVHPAVSGDSFACAGLPAMVRQSSQFASTDETRFVLNSVFLDQNEGKPQLIATDGRRVDVHSVDFALTASVALPVPSPLFGMPDDCTLALDAKASRFEAKAGAYRLVGKLIEGTYPNYKQVIPGDALHMLTFSDAEAQAMIAVERELPTKENAPTIRFGATCEARGDKAKAVIPIAALAEAALTEAYVFNLSYLAEALAIGYRTMEITDSLSPCKLTMSGRIHVLMPMRIA